MDYFTDENITEPLMRYYKDFNYIQYILNLPFKDGFKLYLKCIDLMKEEKEKETKNHIRQVWLIEIQNGLKEDFETYYKRQVKISENKNLGLNFREEEEERIINKIINKEKPKLKERKFIL